MMRRKMADTIRSWRASRGEECLLIKGARQVGKTYIVREVGREDYESFVEVNFIEQPAARQAFESDLSSPEILKRLSLVIPNVSFPAGKTLLFLDEIQECPNARAALKFLAQDPSIDVIASGSLLGISYKDVPSIPVGYEQTLTMHGLDFEEYLWATGFSDTTGKTLLEYAAGLEAVPAEINARMLRVLREYMAVGGMPAVVERFVQTNNFQAAYAEQESILASYLDDIAKYAESRDRAKARACYQSIPRQLAKKNTKFQYGVVEKGGTARKFDASLDWLIDAEMVRPCHCVSTPSFPLAAYERADRFRIYLGDPGLLCAMYGPQLAGPLVEDTLTGPMKGGLYENAVADMLAKSGRKLRYWMNDKGDREIEFLIDGPGSVIPIEVKAKRGASASLDAILEEDSVEVGYKLGNVNVGKAGKKVTLPLYMAAFVFAGPELPGLGRG